MEDLFVFIFSFIIIFIVYIIIYIKRRKNNELKKMKEFAVIAVFYKLNRQKFNYNRLGLLFAFINSLIIAGVGTVCTMIDVNIVWQLLIGFGLLMALIIIFYSIIGFILKKKEGRLK